MIKSNKNGNFLKLKFEMIKRDVCVSSSSITRVKNKKISIAKRLTRYTKYTIILIYFWSGAY